MVGLRVRLQRHGIYIAVVYLCNSWWMWFRKTCCQRMINVRNRTFSVLCEWGGRGWLTSLLKQPNPQNNKCGKFHRFLLFLSFFMMLMFAASVWCGDLLSSSLALGILRLIVSEENQIRVYLIILCIFLPHLAPCSNLQQSSFCSFQICHFLSTSCLPFLILLMLQMYLVLSPSRTKLKNQNHAKHCVP